MAKKLPIEMERIRASETLTLPDIPINSYNKSFETERKHYGDARLTQALHTMLVIREFESMLDSIKKVGEYSGILYNHLGPAHLSIGQESAAVGQCLALEKDDLIFGSHRSHGEIIAKCFSAIESIDEQETQRVFEQWRNGEIYRLVERHYASDSINELAKRTVLYGLLAEIFARDNGFNNGLGGSMHAFFTPLGSMPNNAIVGGSADIAVGAALYKKINSKVGIVIANIGDAAMACGPVWEALTLAAMDQYHTLWGDHAGAPPYLLNVFNNFYGMGGQTVGETMGMGYAARIGAGVNERALHAERVDGFNPLAVADAVARKKKLLLEGQGPALLDTITYRISGHSPSDASSYRTKEEIDEFIERDAIVEYRETLIKHSIISTSDAERMQQQVQSDMRRILELVTDETLTPYVQAAVIEGAMFSREKYPIDTKRKPEVLIPSAENPRVKQLATKKRYAYNENGKAYPAVQLYTLRDAIFEAVIHNAYHNPDLVIYGEENRDWGGAFACYRGLTESLPHHRLFNSPISEGSIVGSAVGYAISGGVALVELMYCDFLGRAGDEVFNQMPKWQAMSGGLLRMPLVLRLSIGDKYGAQHSQDWTALVAHIPGLMVMYPATPYDAKGMLHYALTHSDPVVFAESQKIYGIGERFCRNGVPTEIYEIPLGEPAVRSNGHDLTIITLGPALYQAMEAEEILRERHGITSEVIDLRFVNPLRYETILDSVRKTGRVLLVTGAAERGSFMHTVANHITHNAFSYLDAPPVVLGAQNWITPPAELEAAFFPNAATILDTIDQCLIPLDGHRRGSIQSGAERIRRNAAGV